MADTRIHHSGCIIANIGRLIPPGGFAAWNLGLPNLGNKIAQIKDDLGKKTVDSLE
jgi:hypothetical protein